LVTSINPTLIPAVILTGPDPGGVSRFTQIRYTLRRVETGRCDPEGSEAMPTQAERIIARARAEAGPRASEVVTAAFILGGMHASPDVIRKTFEGAITMIESSAFQVIEDLAKERILREILLVQGTAKYGPPTDDQAANLAGIDNLGRLRRLAARLIKVDSWDALLRGR